jgi:hypothetical protein
MKPPLQSGFFHLRKFKDMEFKMKPMLKTSWLLMAFLLLALPACGGGNLAAVPTVDTAPIFTQVAVTAWAFQTQTAQAVPSATNTAEVSPTPEPTNTPQITNTPLKTAPPPPTSTPPPKPVIVYKPSPTSGGAATSVGPVPNMSTALLVNGSETYSATIYAGTALIFRAQVQNTSNSNIPLQVVANLSVPDGWDVDQDAFSDCPVINGLAQNGTCTISWYFTPQVSGQVILRVNVRGIYTDSAGNSQRITKSPAVIFTVEPAKS